MLQLMKEKYRISSKDMRKILDLGYYHYNQAEKQNHYVQLEEKKQSEDSKMIAVKEMIKKWKTKETITYKSIKNIEEQYHFTMEEIRNTFHISKKDLKDLISGQKKKVKIDLYSERDKQECRKRISNSKKYRASKKLIEQVAKQEKVSTKKAGEILGINQVCFKNLMEEKQLTTKIVDDSLKRQVEKIALDLKYLPNNGNRYYKPNEINFMGLFYKIPTDDMLYYLSSGKTTYETYQEALQNNPEGIWIGEKARLSNEYAEQNHNILNSYITRIAKNLCYQYACNYDDMEDFKSEAFEYILTNGGFYEKNLYHNPAKLNTTLIKNVQNVMKNYYTKQPKELGLTLQYGDKEYENMEALRDDRYNPEICCLEEKYSYLNKIEPLHVDIVREISQNNFFSIEYPKKCFSRIARKHNMTDEGFEEVMGEIRTFILKHKLAKETKDGRIISRFNVDEED